MSLKTLHVVFITCSAVLAAGSAAYAFLTVGGAAGLAWGLVALASGGALIVYGKRFLAKMRELEAAS